MSQSKTILFTVEDMYKAFRSGMDRGSDVARAVIAKNDKLIQADGFSQFIRKMLKIKANIK